MPSAPLSLRQKRTLDLICDTLLPRDDSAWRRSVSTRAAAMLGDLPSAESLMQLRWLLTAFEMPGLSLFVGRQWKPFSALSRAQREAFLGALARHPVGRLRGAFQALKRLAAVPYYADADLAGRNPVWPSLGYPGPLAPSPNVPKTIVPLHVEEDAELVCDVVIVGSGAGGGVVAGELAAAGHDVVVLERGDYQNEADFDQCELSMLRRTYLDGGLTASKDHGVVILAGSCLGGGTVVNYTTSFRTPDPVRAEWARLSGLDLFESDDFTRSLDAVCARLNVNQQHNRPSRRDELMARGLNALGWHVDRMPRDVDGCTQDEVCGYCGLGCVRGAKRSTLKTYLQDAAERGARIVTGCTAERVLVERGRAVGVRARTRAGRDLTVAAHVVVAAAGAIHTPALLLRSGLSGAIGDNLRLHPVTACWASFDREVLPWSGTLQALYSDQLADLDDGYGVKLETAPVHPSLLVMGTAWRDPRQFDAQMRMLAHTSFIGVLPRDRYGGRITIDRRGAPRIEYRVSRYDQRHIRRGLEGAGRVLRAAGANTIWSAQVRPVRLESGGNERLEDWLARVDHVGYGTNRMLYCSFHQMGTCRMGSQRATSVVGPTGETHAVRSLFVADGGLFPSASGVNPMITIAALAHYVGQQIKAVL